MQFGDKINLIFIPNFRSFFVIYDKDSFLLPFQHQHWQWQNKTKHCQEHRRRDGKENFALEKTFRFEQEQQGDENMDK